MIMSNIQIYRAVPGQEHRAAAECRRAGIRAALPRNKMRRPAFGRASSPLAPGYIFAERRPENAHYIHGGKPLGSINRADVSKLWTHCRMRPRARPDNPYAAGDRVIVPIGHMAEVPAQVIEVRLRTCIIAYDMAGKTHQQAVAYTQLRPG